MASALSNRQNCACARKTLQTQRERTHGAGCVRQWFRTAEPLGERRYENWNTHKHAARLPPGHMSERFFPSNRPGYPQPVSSELENSGIRVAVGDCSVTEPRRWRPPYQTGKTAHVHAKHYKHNEDGRTAPGVCGNGSVPLSHSGNVDTRIGIHTHMLPGSHRGHMSERFFPSNRPGYPQPVSSELENSGIRVAVGDCSVSDRRRWRPPYQTGRTAHVHAKHYKHNEDGRTAPGVCDNGSVPLSHSGNVVTRIGIHTVLSGSRYH